MPDQLILNRYRSITEIGSGGFATVQLAWDARIQRRVAIKCIQLNKEDVARGVVSGLDEARTAALLTGDTIVGVYDFEMQDDLAYLIMEYVDGFTLTELLNKFGDQLSLNAVAAIFSSVVQALETAHENQVLHLDIKPDNILINRQGQVKVTDFGLATLSDAAGFRSAVGGTIGYMPPEQMRQESLDVRCDEWALASVAYEILTGKNPFLASDLKAAEAAIVDAEIILPSLCRDDLDVRFDDVLFYALDPDQNGRYDTVSDFAEEMEPFLGNYAKGKRELAILVGHAKEDFETEEELDLRIPLFARLSERGKGIIGRVFSFFSVGLLGAFSLSAIPLLHGFSDPILWALLTLIVVAAILKPHCGAVLGLLALSVAFFLNEAFLLGILLFFTTPCWWFFVGRHGNNQSNTAISPLVFGSLGISSLSPLMIGFCLNIRETCVNVFLALLISFILAGFGSGSLFGWNPFLMGPQVVPDVQVEIWLLMQKPSTWLLVVAWFAAAIIMRVFCLRRTRLFAFFGVVFASGVMLCAVVLGTWFDTAHTSWIVDWSPLVSTIGAAFVASVLCLFGVPTRDDEEVSS